MAAHALLLVEDSPDDVSLIVSAISSVIPGDQIAVIRTGDEVFDYLFGRGKYLGRDIRQQPRLVLLDLNLPSISGLDVLRRLRAEPRTRCLPVVVLSASSEHRHIRAAAQIGANSYVRKSHDYTRFHDTLQLLSRYWLEFNVPPPVSETP
ncbi:MAG TPA: response regulator [Rhodocyclaceae bacterium]|nr:response regulator [Rhodocyclaceae bacterium]